MKALPFHPLINEWFAETYGTPTPVQEEAWPLIAGGAHVLALAPTGSGKTLTAFLSAISRFADGSYPEDRLSVLYVSPLKALNEDIRRNLIFPIEGIKARFEKAGETFPALRAETRSGDTPQSERRRFLSRPPSILALTPESLGILLLNPRGRQVLSSVRYVILDEIHTALGSKRGCYLSCQIDRLALVAGEFQRVALSATVKPPEAAADFSGGLVKTPSGYEKRKVHIVAPKDKKAIEFKVVFPGAEWDAGAGSAGSETKSAGTEDARGSAGPEISSEENSADVSAVAGAGQSEEIERYGKSYTRLATFIIERIKAYNCKGTILVFTDSRRRAERISFVLNELAGRLPLMVPEFAGRPIAYTHHGSLSKDVRRSVEKALASGEIPCVVATGSLELGIDIGAVEEVILAGSPGSAAQTLQRLGRSGHSVGRTSKGWLFAFHGMDLLQAAALSGAVEERELETVAVIENPLDILAQIILAMCVEKEWNEDDLYETLRGFFVYQKLSRPSFDGVLRMLAGAYEGTRLRELSRRVFRDEETGTLRPAPGALPLLYTSGGVIASRGYYSLRLAPGTEGAGTKIGELDEEFVWERRLGDCFDFGNRSWRITAIGAEAVEALPLPDGAGYAPFWKGDAVYRSPVLSRRMLEVLEGYHPKAWTSLEAEKMLGSFTPEAKEALEDFLHSQWSFQKIPLSGPDFIPVEIIDNPEDRGDALLIVLHSFRGGGVNFPLHLAMARELEARYGVRVEGSADDNAVFVRLPRSIAASPAELIGDSLRRLSQEGEGEKRFKERLESSGVFGAAFREAAERSLLLPRSPFGKRIPLWVTRQKSKRLFDAVSSYRDFPAAAEAWRSCLRETFDMEGFAEFLNGVRSGALSFEYFFSRRSSPFCQGLAWAEVNTLMYEYDERPDLMGHPSQELSPSLSDRVIAEALGEAGKRPRLKAGLIDDFCSRLRREIPGWAPEDALTLCEWVKERVAIPAGGSGDAREEWERLLSCVPSELAEALEEDKTLGGKLEYLTRDKAGSCVVVHRDWAKKWKEASGTKLAAECLGQWLRYEGPLPLSRIEGVFGLSRAEAEEALSDLGEQGKLSRDVAVEGEAGAFAPDLVCDRENLELLLRLSRRRQRPTVKERPACFLAPFLARRQGLLRGGVSASERVARSAGESAAQRAADFQDARQLLPWKHLSGIAASAKLWETDFFPCRLPSYSAETLDREIREGRLLWYGTGKEKTAFCGPEDLELYVPASRGLHFSGKLPPEFFDSPRTFWEIRDALGAGAAGIASDTGLNGVVRALWEEVWRGGLSADSWEPVRRAAGNGFALPESGTGDYGARPGAPGNANMGRRFLRVPRAIRERWRSGPPVAGNWFSLRCDDSGFEALDPLEEEDLNRERVRVLLDRWGVLARPLLEREAPLLSWSRLLPAMRRMELAGELVAGRFFGGVNSLQFASPEIASELEEAEAERGVYWMNAADPASPAGLAVEGAFRKPQAPRRTPSTRLCFRGAELIALSGRGGKEAEIFIPADDPDIGEVLAFIKFPRARSVRPESKIIIERINGASAALSGYSSALGDLGFVKDRGRLVLW